MKEVVRTEKLGHLVAFREAQNGYGNKLKQRIINAFDNAQLSAVGGEVDGRVLKAEHFLPHVPQNPLCGADVVEAASFNITLPQVMGNMNFANGLSQEGYVSGIGGHDFSTLPRLAVAMAKDKEASDVVIRVVQGATCEMPLRSLSYIAPALTLMEKLQEQGIRPPQLQVISTHHISGGLNGVDADVAEQQARLFAEVASAYVETFFPDLVDAVVFLQDVPLDKESFLRDELIRIARVVKEKGSSVDDALAEKGHNNGAHRTRMFYAGAHLVVHDASLPMLQPFIEGVEAVKDPKTIISIGGKQEEIFYKLRHELKPFVGDEYQRVNTLQYFTNHHVPPYYMAKQDGEVSDVSLNEALQTGKVPGVKHISKTAQFDIDYLEKVSNRRGDLDEFLKQRGRRAA